MGEALDRNDKPVRPGCTIRRHDGDETWEVKEISGDRVLLCGWPNHEGFRLCDIKVVESIKRALETPCGATMGGAIDAGDHVTHDPTGKSWVVAHVTQSSIFTVSMTPVQLPLRACSLYRKATVKEREKLLLQLRSLGVGDPRGEVAQQRLARRRTLKRCPCCGAAAKLDSAAGPHCNYGERVFYSIKCTDWQCDIRTPGIQDPERVLEIWSKRVK